MGEWCDIFVLCYQIKKKEKMTSLVSGKGGGIANAILAQRNIIVGGGSGFGGGSQDSNGAPTKFVGIGEGSEELGVTPNFDPIQQLRSGENQLRFPPNFQEYQTLPKLKRQQDQVLRMVPDQKWFGEAYTKDQYANTPLNAYNQPQPPIDKPIPQRHHDMIEDEAKQEPPSQFMAGMSIDDSCPIASDGLTWDHRGVYANRRVHANTTGRKVNATFALQSPSSQQIPGMTYGKYNHEAFYTHRESDKRNLLATGILKNSWSGEQYEILEEQMPLPDTGRHSILPQQLKKISPKLVALLGQNPHQPYRPKQEIKAITYADGGRNAFGQQLYAEPLRSRLESVATQSVWGNRNGVYSTPISINGKEKPWGKVGLNDSVRLFAEFPATQRTDYESFNRPVAGPSSLHENLGDRAKNFPKQVKKKCTRIGDSNNETTDRTCPFVNGVDAPMIDIADHRDGIDTQREVAEDPQNSASFNIDGEYKAGNVSADLNAGGIRPTMKGHGEEWEVSNAYGKDMEASLIRLDNDVRDTLKFEAANLEAPITGVNLGLILSNDEIRDTLKIQMEQAPVLNNGELTLANQPRQLDIADNELRDTLKITMEEAPPVEYGAFEHGELPVSKADVSRALFDLKEDEQPMLGMDNPGQSVTYGPTMLNSNDVRETLKNSLLSTEPEGLPTGQNVGMVNLTDNQIRDSLKTSRETAQPEIIDGMNSGFTGASAMNENQIRDTEKMLMESYPQPLTSTGYDEGAGQYVAGNFTTVKPRETYRNLLDPKKQMYTPSGPVSQDAGGICDAGTLKWTKKFEKDVNYYPALGKTTDGNSSVMQTPLKSNRVGDMRDSKAYNLGQGSIESTLWDRVTGTSRCPTVRGNREHINPILNAAAPVM
jgi:hypothetical protein